MDQQELVGFMNSTMQSKMLGKFQVDPSSVQATAPPSIYYVDPATEVGTEENVTLTCHAHGLPEPTFTWITRMGTMLMQRLQFMKLKSLMMTVKI
ncbi:hypothetical protein OS493_021545 [Desmophyllum pertusum]|uniref:Ig-like domain-containing protein n=1 Tax=Desmophyllum pertusum TaxID=174260 RepID=A0A9X0CJG0_9CNID|nr:hypothetical protein OS493_021545 [Desmophyllum pertusum]